MKKILGSYVAAAMLGGLAYAGTPHDVYPTPQGTAMPNTALSIKASDLAASSFAQNAELLRVLQPALNAAKLKAEGQIPIIVERDPNAVQQQFQKQNIKDVPGAYFLSVKADKIEIVTRDEMGIFYAAQTLARMIEVDGKIAVCDILDWPDVPYRGSVEGFYGRVWTHEARLSQIRFYGKYKMNAYIYGPKDDPYHKNRWREPYPEEQARKLEELATVSRQNHVDFIWAIHLGASFNQNEKEKEYRLMEEKFEHMYGLGIRAFAIFFDDFGGADGNFHAEACNRATAWLKKKGDCAPLVLCPNQYNKAWSGGNYLDILGEKLDPSVNVMWTGDTVCHDITADGQDWINNRIKRKAYIWWNWPVVDYCSTALLLGRTYGLAKENKDKYSGFVSNPMDKPEASKIALFSVGDYCWNVDGFDSVKSWKAGIRQMYPDYAEAMQVLANHSSDQGPNGHGYRREESVEFKPIIEKAAQELKNGKLSAETAKSLTDEFKKMQWASQELAAKIPGDNADLWLEIQCWVKTLGETGYLGEVLTNAAMCDSKQSCLEALCKAAYYYVARNAAMESQREHAKRIGAPHQNPSKLAELVVMPFLNNLYATTWSKLAGERKQVAQTDLYKVVTTVPQLAKVGAGRDKIYVSMNRVLEQVQMAPGQYIGLVLPTGVPANYIHIKLDNNEALKKCIVEVSTDGKKWERQDMRVGDGETQTRLDPNRGIRFMRFVNPTNQTFTFRINMFKFDVPAEAKANSKGAAQDGDPMSSYIVEQQDEFVGPAHGKNASVLTDQPQCVKVVKEGKQVKVRVKAGETPVHVFEIIWR